MALLSSAASLPSHGLRGATAKNPSNIKAAQALAKQKSLEKKSKSYRLPMGELALFTQQLASLLAAGLPLVQCLEALQDQTEDACFRIVIRDVRADISQGNSFSSAVRKFPHSFNTLFVSMVEAGEASGGLAEILMKVAGYFESTVKLTKKVKSAMTYPIAVIGLAVALVNVLLIFVIPVFAAMFADFGAKLPAPTQFLIDVSDFMKWHPRSAREPEPLRTLLRGQRPRDRGIARHGSQGAQFGNAGESFNVGIHDSRVDPFPTPFPPLPAALS